MDFEGLKDLYEGAYVLDENRKIVFFNAAAERMTGFKAGDAVDRFEHDNLMNIIDENGMQLSILPRYKEDELVYIQHALGHRIPVYMKTLPFDTDQESSLLVELFHEAKAKNHANLAKGAVDRVTGLANKGYVAYLIQHKLAAYRGFGIPLGIFMVDIDNFEAMNQTYGKSFCDRIFKMIGTSYKESLLTADLVGRWHGDSFIVLVDSVSQTDMRRMAEKLRIIAENSAIRGELFKDVEVTVSIGGTKVRTDDSYDSLMERLTAHLKEAKSKGGNSSRVK